MNKELNIAKLILRLSLVAIFVGLFLWRGIVFIDHRFITDAVWLAATAIMAFVVSVIALVGDIKGYRRSKRKWAFMPTLCAVLCVVALVLTNIAMARRDSAKVVLHCVSEHVDFNGVVLLFRADSTYMVSCWSSFGGDFYRGRYKWQDSLITLDDSPGCLVNRRFVLKESTFKGKVYYALYGLNEYGAIDPDKVFNIKDSNDETWDLPL